MAKDEPSIADEEWERFLRDAESGSRSAPVEPSARARMVSRRLREEPGPPPGWRTHQPPGRGRRKVWHVVGLLLAVGLLALALDPGRVVGWFGDTDGASASPAGEPASQLPTPEEPFRGSPAADWYDGLAGISVPEARATGWMTKEQVAQALDRTQAFLAASSLDPEVLRGERPEEAIALINPRQRDVQDYLAAAFREPSQENDPLLLFSRFSQSKVRLVGDVVKTRGQLTFREGRRGAVEVTSDVTYVYPVVRAGTDGDEVARTIARRETVMSWDDPAEVITKAGTFSLLSYKVDATNGGCDNSTGYFLPEFTAERAPEGSGQGPEVDPYDRDTSMDTRMREGEETECGTATRT
ncbi:hypothetical protein OG705_31880 [Streptomyces sp. NBC_00838]|uniref:hypothetical protein n=1 Tax=Streptomyces sp. NBC_00838 TaxID=2903680 RepID=UPI0038689200|nr:hypothetical protein OG705_31880 [Streptomyces sp. NBC_00838]